MKRTRKRLGHVDCEIVSPEVDPPALPVLFVHGLGGGIWGWENFQRRFAERGRTTWAVELPFHGDEHDQRLGAYSVETFALYVAGLLPHIGRCVVVGHSMGGLIAQKLAETYPQAGYVFMCSAPPWHMFRRAYGRMWKHVLRHPARDLIRSLRRDTMVLNEGLEDELVNNRLSDEVRHQIYTRDVPDSGRASLQMALGLIKVDERHVTAPCLVIGGAADGLIPASEQRAIAAYYGCPARIYDRGHMMIIEDGWEEIADDLLAWVEEREREENAAANSQTASMIGDEA